MTAPPTAGPRGFDGAKKVDGVKRHIRVDTAGTLVAALLTPANVQDRAAFRTLLRQAKPIAPTIAHEGFLIPSQITSLLHRLDRSQLFDTL